MGVYVNAGMSFGMGPGMLLVWGVPIAMQVKMREMKVADKEKRA